MELSDDGKGLLDAKTPRRDFLKYLGFSTAAATLAASCEMPVRNIIPYVNKPENMVPGVADYYATTFVSGGDAVPIVAKVRDGRPIKLEGNELSGVTKGGTSARVQASVLDLYDTARLRYPVQMVNGVPQEVTSFEAFDKMVADSTGRHKLVPIGIADTDHYFSYHKTNHCGIPCKISRTAAMCNTMRILTAVCCWPMKHLMEKEQFLLTISTRQK